MALTTNIAHNLIQKIMPDFICSIVKFYVHVCDRVMHINIYKNIYELI